MKKIFLILTIVAIGLTIFISKKQIKREFSTSSLINVQKNTNTISSRQSIFIPYWNLNGDLSNLSQYDRLFYFGIKPEVSGINKEEPGYTSLDQFVSRVPAGIQKYVTVRMLDADINSSILADPKIQDKIISETINIAKNKNIEGIALDLEITNILSQNLKGQINEFVQQFYLMSKVESLKFFVILPGDTIYRKRPFDIATIARHSDGVLIMAYDFHKSISEPGPLFPYSGNQKYGYDFQTMIADYLSEVPKDKVTVVFGLFGYDWTVDEKKRPIKPAKALNLIEIRKQFLGRCEWKDCLVKRDERSKETEVDYINSQVVDNYGYIEYHIVWFEDEESVQIKKDFLKGKGIGNVAYWAFGYF